MMPPVFVKGHLTFSIEGHNLEFTNQNISVFGCMGLKWEPLNSREHFGKTVQVTITCPNADPLMIKTEAHIIREFTTQSEYMGLRFHLSDENREKLKAQVTKYGTYPTEYIRKHPRIPSSSLIQTFPLRVIGTPDSWRQLYANETIIPLVFDVGNLSPNGILMSTENQMSKSVVVGEYIDMVLEPRGWFPTPVKVRGVICRITDDLNPQNGNFTRSLGIKFVKVDEVNRTAFLDLLKDILERFKTLQSGI